MGFAIDSVVRECHVYKDVGSAGIDSELPCSPKSAIAKDWYAITHSRFDALKTSYDTVNFCCGD